MIDTHANFPSLSQECSIFNSFEYTLRLNTPGQFVLPPSRVEAMYAPDRFGEVPNAALEVVP